MAVAVSPVIEEARKRWKRAAEAEKAQREAILLAKKFRALDQWPAAIKVAREGQASISGQPQQPPRPCLVVDRLSQPVRIESNKIKNADFGFDALPNGGGADRETADILKGAMRRMHNQSRSESPIEWAADGAIEGGLGWLRMRTDYVHEDWDGDPNDPEAYDQELRLYRIANNLSVYCDPGSTHPTRRDALYMFIVQDMEKEAFRDRFKDADLRGLEEFQSTGDMADWVQKETIRVAEYWRVLFEDRRIWMLEDGTAGEGKPPKGSKPKFERLIRRPSVKGSLISAIEELEQFAWVGRRIPIFPILGEELNVDGKTVLRGIITMGMDAQRMTNYTYSAAVEIFALEPKKAPRVVAASIANYKSVWDTRNLYNYAYHPYDAFDTEGRPIPPPQDDNSEAPIQAAVALMKVSEEALKASTSTGDASLGNTNPNERSGRALEALQSQTDLANSNYPDNVRRTLIDIAEEAVYVIPKITRPGQVVHILGIDDKPEQVMFGQPFQVGPDGVPQPAPPTVTPEMAKMKDNLWKFYDPSAGRYSTTVTVGKATATRLQEGSKALGELIPHLPPEMAAVATPEYVKQLSFPGAQGIAERLTATLPPHLQPAKDGEETPIPPEVKAQMDQMGAALQEAQTAIQTDQAKQQATIQTAQLREEGEMARARLEVEAKIEIARMDNATKLQIEEWKLRGTAMQAELDARQAALGAEQKDADRAAKLAEGEAGRQHESAEAQEAREHAEREAAEGRSHEAVMAERAAEAAAEQAALKQPEAGA